MTSTSTLRSRAAAAVAIAASTALVLGACSDSDTQTSAATTTETVEPSQSQSQSQGNADDEAEAGPLGSPYNPMPLDGPVQLNDGLQLAIDNVRTNVSGSEIESMNCDRARDYGTAAEIVVTNPAQNSESVMFGNYKVGFFTKQPVPGEVFYKATGKCLEYDQEQTTWQWASNGAFGDGLLEPGDQMVYTAYLDESPDELTGLEIVPGIDVPRNEAIYTDFGEFSAN